jgi:hypothetical protein
MLSWALGLPSHVLLGFIGVLGHCFRGLCWCSWLLFSWAFGVYAHVLLGFVGVLGYCFHRLLVFVVMFSWALLVFLIVFS